MTNDQLPPDKILERIRKLLALSTSSNEYEAALAASRAQDLLLKYNLEMSQIEQKEGDEVERWDFRTPLAETWLDVLINGIATNNMCRVIRGKGYKDGYRDGAKFVPGKEVRHYYMFGKKPNLEVTVYMYSYLAAEIDRLTPEGKNATYVRAFRIGAASKVAERMKEELRTFQSTEETKALVVVTDKAVTERLKQDFPKTSTSHVSIGDSRGYYDGQAAGKTIQFRQGVGGKNAAGQALLA